MDKLFSVSKDVLDDTEINPYAFKLYCYIKRIIDERGFCEWSSRELADGCNISDASVSRGKKLLVSKGLINIDRDAKKMHPDIITLP